MTKPDTPLISTEALVSRRGAPDLRIIDASWWLDGRDARADFERERLPGAVFFDLDAVSDRNSPYPHMLPSPDIFAEAMGALGVAESDDIVVYDAQGKGYLIQCDRGGYVTFYDASSGIQLNSVDLGSRIDSTPAVFNNMLVVGTRGKGGSGKGPQIVCLKIS